MRFLIISLLAVGAVSCALPGPSVTPSAPGRVAGILLVAAEPSLRASCSRAAALGGFAVPCPRLIIEHRQPVGEGCPDQDRPYAGGKDCLEDSAAGNPSGPSRRDALTYLQNDIVFPGAVHLWVVGVEEDSRLAPFRSGCVPGPEVAEPGPDLSGSATTWVECPDGSAMNSGHVLLRWARAGVIYAVSLHGHTSIDREVEVAIARNIEYVAP